MLISIDSNMNVNCLSNSYNYEWMRLCNIKMLIEKGKRFWPVGCYGNKVLGIVYQVFESFFLIFMCHYCFIFCIIKGNFPSITPKPLISTCELKIPLIGLNKKMIGGIPNKNCHSILKLLKSI